MKIVKLMGCPCVQLCTTQWRCNVVWKYSSILS